MDLPRNKSIEGKRGTLEHGALLVMLSFLCFTELLNVLKEQIYISKGLVANVY